MKRDLEKRKFERVPFNESVVIDVENDWTALGTAADLSLGGMFVESLDAQLTIPFGARVTVHVRVANDLVELPGIVRWTRGGGVGVQFGLLGARETHAITEAIARQVPSRARERAAENVAEEIDVDVDDVDPTGTS